MQPSITEDFSLHEKSIKFNVLLIMNPSLLKIYREKRINKCSFNYDSFNKGRWNQYNYGLLNMILSITEDFSCSRNQYNVYLIMISPAYPAKKIELIFLVFDI